MKKIKKIKFLLPYHKFYLVLLFLVLSLSCNRKECMIEIDQKVAKSRKLTFALLKLIDNCKYQARVNFWADSISIVSEAIAYNKEHSFFFKILEPESKQFKFFDFNLDKGKIYEVKIPFKDGSVGYVRVVLEHKYQLKSDENIFKFKIINGFDYNGLKLDQIIFISSKKGFIGNYFQNIGEGSNYVIAPAGNILKDIIDYSKSEFRVLK